MSAEQTKPSKSRHPILQEIAETSVSAVHLYFAPLMGAVRVVSNELRGTPKTQIKEPAK